MYSRKTGASVSALHDDGQVREFQEDDRVGRICLGSWRRPCCSDVRLVVGDNIDAGELLLWLSSHPSLPYLSHTSGSLLAGSQDRRWRTLAKVSKPSTEVILAFLVSDAVSPRVEECEVHVNILVGGPGPLFVQFTDSNVSGALV